MITTFMLISYIMVCILYLIVKYNDIATSDNYSNYKWQFLINNFIIILLFAFLNLALEQILIYNFSPENLSYAIISGSILITIILITIYMGDIVFQKLENTIPKKIWLVLLIIVGTFIGYYFLNNFDIRSGFINKTYSKIISAFQNKEKSKSLDDKNTKSVKSVKSLKSLKSLKSVKNNKFSMSQVLFNPANNLIINNFSDINSNLCPADSRIYHYNKEMNFNSRYSSWLKLRLINPRAIESIKLQYSYYFLNKQSFNLTFKLYALNSNEKTEFFCNNNFDKTKYSLINLEDTNVSFTYDNQNFIKFVNNELIFNNDSNYSDYCLEIIVSGDVNQYDLRNILINS